MRFYLAKCQSKKTIRYINECLFEKETSHGRVMRKFYQTVMVCAVFACVSMPVTAEPLQTLQQIVEKAVTSNPEVQARYHTFKSSEQERNVARGGLLPRVDVVSTWRDQERLTPNIGNTATPEYQTQLILRQMLFDGFSTIGEVNRLDHAKRVRYYELMSAMQNTALETVRAYIDVQRYRQLVDYAQDNYVVHKQLFDRIQERVNAGVARRVDFEQASGRLALAEANLLTETTNLHDVTARYQRLVGELPPATLQEVDFFKGGVSPTPTEALKLAYQQNPDLLGAIENIVATQEEVSSKRGRYYPRLDFQARKNLDVSSDGTNSSSAADIAELTLTFNLFNGLSDISTVSQTAEKLNTSQDLRDKACVDTRQTVVIAYNDIERLREQLGYRDTHQLSIEKAREAYRKQFDIGQRTLLDLLDTENEYFQARRAYTNTERDLYTAYARTYAAQGELLGKLGVVRGDLPDFGRAGYLDRENICQAVAPEALKIDKLTLVSKAAPISSALPSLADKQPQSTKPEAPAKPDIPKKLIPDIGFEDNSAKLTGKSLPILDGVAETINRWGKVVVEVGGHTDRRKTSKADYNLKLSNSRANAVRDYLISKGVAADRLVAKGYGFEQPIAENDPQTGNPVNRRVELVPQQ